MAGVHDGGQASGFGRIERRGPDLSRSSGPAAQGAAFAVGSMSNGFAVRGGQSKEVAERLSTRRSSARARLTACSKATAR